MCKNRGGKIDIAAYLGNNEPRKRAFRQFHKNNTGGHMLTSTSKLFMGPQFLFCEHAPFCLGLIVNAGIAQEFLEILAADHSHSAQPSASRSRTPCSTPLSGSTARSISRSSPPTVAGTTRCAVATITAKARDGSRVQFQEAAVPMWAQFLERVENANWAVARLHIFMHSEFCGRKTCSLMATTW